MAAEPRRADRGRCGHIRAPHPGGSVAAGGEEDRGRRKGSGSDLHRPVQPAGGAAGRLQLSVGKHWCEMWLTSLVPVLSGRLWRFWPSTAPTVTLMKEWRWTSSVQSRYCLLPQRFHHALVASQWCASRLLCPVGSPQRSLWWSASAAPDGRETGVSCHISLLASPRAPRRAASHTRLPQDLLSAQSLTKPNSLKCIQGLCGANILYWLI